MICFMKKPVAVIYLTIVLDAVGVGLVFPILPALLQEVSHTDNVAPLLGVMMALYAAIQFVSAPALGALSDRIGRRPVLLISLAGATANYLCLALASSIWWLMIGRALAGLTAANASVAGAYLTDVTSQEQRTRRFGLMNAMFGAGFIIGPVLGGVLGDYGLRLPFVVAAMLAGSTFLLAFFALPESHTPSREPMRWVELNPLKAFHGVFGMKEVLPMVVLFFLFSAAGEVYGTCWALWGSDAFHWNGLWVGMSLGAFGVCQMFAQAFLPGFLARLLGDRATVLTGVACACVALLVLALASHGWMVFAVMPIFALGGIGAPVLQALATSQVDEGMQGQFQGVLASAVSLASVGAPLAFSGVYFGVKAYWPGAVWLSALGLYALMVPLVLGMQFAKTPSTDTARVLGR